MSSCRFDLRELPVGRNDELPAEVLPRTCQSVAQVDFPSSVLQQLALGRILDQAPASLRIHSASC